LLSDSAWREGEAEEQHLVSMLLEEQEQEQEVVWLGLLAQEGHCWSVAPEEAQERQV